MSATSNNKTEQNGDDDDDDDDCSDLLKTITESMSFQKETDDLSEKVRDLLEAAIAAYKAQHPELFAFLSDEERIPLMGVSFDKFTTAMQKARLYEQIIAFQQREINRLQEELLKH